MFFAGLKGQPVDIYKYFDDNGLDGFNLVASIARLRARDRDPARARQRRPQLATRGARAGHDPWGGATLEWFALSPPPEHNFDAVPDVRSAEPLHDIRRAIRDRTESWRPPPPPRPERAGRPEPARPSRSAGDGRRGRRRQPR